MLVIILAHLVLPQPSYCFTLLQAEINYYPVFHIFPNRILLLLLLLLLYCYSDSGTFDNYQVITNREKDVKWWFFMYSILIFFFNFCVGSSPSERDLKAARRKTLYLFPIFPIRTGTGWLAIFISCSFCVINSRILKNKFSQRILSAFEKSFFYWKISHTKSCWSCFAASVILATPSKLLMYGRSGILMFYCKLCSWKYVDYLL